MNLLDYIRDIPDFPKKGILFKDLTPLLNDASAFTHAICELARLVGSVVSFDRIACAEARGFLFAAPLAFTMGKPLIPLRKPGKLPHYTHNWKYSLEYGEAELQIHQDALQKGERILLMDDVLATGGTMEAAAKLVEKAGGVVSSCLFLLELKELGGRHKLTSYDVRSLLTYPEELTNEER